MTPLRGPSPHVGFSLLALSGALLGSTTAHAQSSPRLDGAKPAASIAAAPDALHVRVRGSSEIVAAAITEAEGFSLHVDLVDDTGSPIPGQPMTISASDRDDPRARVRIDAFAPCDGSTTRPVRGSGSGDTTIETDERGSACVSGKSPSPHLVVDVRYAGNKLHDAFTTQVPIDVDQDRAQRAMLRFEPPTELVDLDRTAIAITAALRVERSSVNRSGIGPRRDGVALMLEDERGARVADAVTGGDGRARFEVMTASLAGPGSGELVVRFNGRPGLARATISQPVVRRAEVLLALSHPIERADADAGFDVDVDVTTSRGAVSGGVIEVRRLGGEGTEAVGAATVDAGHARVGVSFAAGGTRKAQLAIRYVPAAPWFRAGHELRTEVALAGPSSAKQVVLALIVLAAAAWIVGGWRRAPKAAQFDEPILPGVAPGRAGVHVLGPATGIDGWRGTIADAHDGTPIANAHVRVVAPSFKGDGVVADTRADEHGSFTLETPYRPDARLVVEAPLHSAHEQALPPPSLLSVALVTRRRTLLDRLVRWARRQGAPFDNAPEPTPGHVRRAAARLEAAEVEAWARQVEMIAYGPDPVGEPTELEVRSGEPRPGR